MTNHICLECGTGLVKKPGPGRWPIRCDAHRISSVGPAMMRTCALDGCQNDVPGKRPTGPAPLYCSRTHRRRADYVRRRDGILLAEKQQRAESLRSQVRCCPQCQNDFIPTHGKQLYCSKQCLTTRFKDSATKVCSELECGRPLRAKGLCNMHYKRVLRAEGRIKSAPWDDRRRNNYHARRARLKGGRNGDPVMLAELVVRDRSMCAGCGDPVDLSVAWPDPMSKSIDHIIPISRGGAHSLENCQLMHLGCNVSKGDKVA